MSKSPSRKIVRLVWPDDSILSVHGFFGPDNELVTEIVETEKPGGLGPALWYHVRSAHGLVTDVNAAYLALVIYAKPRPEASQVLSS